jgi:hypothetical protein
MKGFSKCWSCNGQMEFVTDGEGRVVRKCLTVTCGRTVPIPRTRPGQSDSSPYSDKE